MKRPRRRAFARAGGWAVLLWLSSSLAEAEPWPAWRGPRGDGTSREKNVPVRWTTEQGVAWRVAVPGAGHASPILWGDRLFTVTTLLDQEERLLLCYDVPSGRPRWQRTVLHSPLERKHALNSYASSTPATDGQRIYVAFLDRQEMLVAAYDFEGVLLWTVRPGPFASMHGFCSSPVLFQNLVIVNGDHDGDSYLVALDRATGKTVWKTPRENRTRSYCAPIILDLAGRTQMILSGDRCVASYDPGTGQRHWVIDGPTEQFVASIVYNAGADLLFVTGGYPEHHILAVRPDGSGNITQTHIAWRTTRGAAYVPSPISEGDYFLVVSDSGVAHCFEAATGHLAWHERTGEQHASLVSANGLVYFLNDNGVTHVVRPGPDYELIASNDVAERCFASPAISGGRIYMRSDRHLFCIGPTESAGP